ncbi:regulator of G-protein signaling protein-like [Mytilus californianus]|uniref:regulator of G-protein signaling protein-like n=1 Tax=Mytilus californianus TaxID=6549 RepID=UPI0022450406|nr:regulator of G-protein signaling protein-like [Mytilus californianus]
MMGEKTRHPLAFWKSIEELRDMPAGRRRKIRIRNILRRNFSKKAKHGAFLDCNDDIMKQIPFMKKVPISVLECAQASVYRSMEMKWYPKYLETYPPDPGDEVPEIQGLGAEDLERIEEKPKKKKKQKTLVLWQRFVSTIMGFLKSIREEDEIKLLHLFLKKQIQKALIRQLKQYQALFKDEADKAIVNPSNAKFEARILLKNRLVILDKLPSDLRFFGEVTKYVGQVDHIQSLENISQESMDFLNDKAREMVNCFLISDILPQNQLNIPEELAQTIISSLENEGATRGLFHDAFILIFPVLYHYWRQCQKKWLKHYTASELIGLIEKQNRMREKPTTPHKCTEVPDFLRLRESQMKIATKFMPGDEQFIINFSLRGGCKKFIPVPKVPAQNDKDRRASVMSRRTSMMGRRTSLLGRRTSLSMKQSSKSIRGSETIISDTSPPKEKEKEKEKSVSKSISMLMQKMHALAEEGSQGSKSPGSDKANFVDEIIEKSANTPSRLRKMNDLVSAAVQDKIDGTIFGDDNE